MAVPIKATGHHRHRVPRVHFFLEKSSCAPSVLPLCFTSIAVTVELPQPPNLEPPSPSPSTHGELRAPLLSIPHLGKGLTPLSPRSYRATPLSSPATRISAPTSRTVAQPPSTTSPPPRVVSEPEPPHPYLAHPPTSTGTSPRDLAVAHRLSHRPRLRRHHSLGAVTAQLARRVRSTFLGRQRHFSRWVRPGP
jgi:hypothetical protein